MDSLREIGEAFLLKGISEYAKEKRHGRKPLLTVDNSHCVLVVIYNEVSDEILCVVLNNCIVPKILDVRTVPGIGTLKSWNPVKRLFEKLANLFIEASDFHVYDRPFIEASEPSQLAEVIVLGTKLEWP